MLRSHLASVRTIARLRRKKKLRIISRTVDIIKCCCLVFMRYLPRTASMSEAYHPLVQMLWEVFKGFVSFREEGAVQPL